MIVLASALLFFLFLAIFVQSRTYFEWPANWTQSELAIYVAIVFGMLPLVFYLLNFLSERGAAFKVRVPAEISLDFSKAASQAPRLNLPDNMFVPGSYQTLAHSGSEEVLKAISKTTSSPVVTLNLRDGGGWWVTRLLALSAGAVESDAPRAIVFLATKETVEKTFIAWAEPQCVLHSILTKFPDYATEYYSAKTIYRQLLLFSQDQFDNKDLKPGFELSPLATKYTYTYQQGGENSFVQILLDRLSPLEKSPKSVTPSVVFELFDHCMYTRHVELGWPGEEQARKVLHVRAPYVAFTEGGQFVGMIPIEHAISTVIQHMIGR